PYHYYAATSFTSRALVHDRSDVCFTPARRCRTRTRSVVPPLPWERGSGGEARSCPTRAARRPLLAQPRPVPRGARVRRVARHRGGPARRVLRRLPPGPRLDNTGRG